jgi:pimeloyl-ACP methyl ester carboxylesterase
VFFFGGDFSPEQIHDTAWSQKNLSGNVQYMQTWANRLRVRYVYVSRLGLQGSSGTHGERRFPRETIVINAAIDALKDRLGVDTVALAGQSGGSTIAASLVTMGRQDVVCDILGSGALELVDLEFQRASDLGVKVTKAALAKKMYDPASHIDSVVARPDRRVFVLGDPTDTEVPYRFQIPFVDRFKAAGHRAMAIEVDAQGAQHHDVGRFTYPAAGACLNGVADDAIVFAIARGQSWGQQQYALSSLGQQRRKFVISEPPRSASN